MCFTEQSFVKMHFETTELVSTMPSLVHQHKHIKTKTAHTCKKKKVSKNELGKSGYNN